MNYSVKMGTEYGFFLRECVTYQEADEFLEENKGKYKRLSIYHYTDRTSMELVKRV